MKEIGLVKNGAAVGFAVLVLFAMILLNNILKSENTNQVLLVQSALLQTLVGATIGWISSEFSGTASHRRHMESEAQRIRLEQQMSKAKLMAESAKEAIRYFFEADSLLVKTYGNAVSGS